MFCYQCEQTAGGACCTGNAGVCGKTSEVAAAQDELTSALITLGKVVSVKSLTPSANVNRMMLEGMFATLTNVNFDEASIKAQTAAVKDATRELCPEAATCDCAAYDVNTLWRSDNADDKSLRTLVLLGCRGLAAYAYHASVLGQEDADVYAL
ncbi:MAG: hypothetical protein LBM21_01895 [Coriobacteriales bacterium]|jgi:hydroxylamine reductase|nr:hypothetical protein [Coriobacteriales bacterium]